MRNRGRERQVDEERERFRENVRSRQRDVERERERVRDIWRQ